jgi:hypothetical protein
MRRRFQFSLRALLVATFGVACFFGGIGFERERRRRADEAAAALAANSPPLKARAVAKPIVGLPDDMQENTYQAIYIRQMNEARSRLQKRQGK